MFGIPTLTSWQGVRLVSTAVIAAMLGLSASTTFAQEQKTITVVLTQGQFMPSTITLTAGQPVQLNIQNQGKLDHNLSSDDLPLTNINFIKADNSTQDLSRYVSTNVLNADALAGHTSVVALTPMTAGTFGLFSEDEESLGTTGKFIVVAPVTSPTTAASSTASTTVARDNQTLSGQPTATQAMLTAVWGDRAAQEWAQEHNAAPPRWVASPLTGWFTVCPGRDVGHGSAGGTAGGNHRGRACVPGKSQA